MVTIKLVVFAATATHWCADIYQNGERVYRSPGYLTQDEAVEDGLAKGQDLVAELVPAKTPIGLSVEIQTRIGGV